MACVRVRSSRQEATRCRHHVLQKKKIAVVSVSTFFVFLLFFIGNDEPNSKSTSEYPRARGASNTTFEHRRVEGEIGKPNQGQLRTTEDMIASSGGQRGNFGTTGGGNFGTAGGESAAVVGGNSTGGAQGGDVARDARGDEDDGNPSPAFSEEKVSLPGEEGEGEGDSQGSAGGRTREGAIRPRSSRPRSARRPIKRASGDDPPSTTRERGVDGGGVIGLAEGGTLKEGGVAAAAAAAAGPEAAAEAVAAAHDVVSPSASSMQLDARSPASREQVEVAPHLAEADASEQPRPRRVDL